MTAEIAPVWPPDGADAVADAEPGEPVFAGPDSVVFGMIGDDFVVGSDRQAAREAATLETEPASEPAASALRVSPRALAGELGTEAGEVLERVIDPLEIGFSADPRATRAHARMPHADRARGAAETFRPR